MAFVGVLTAVTLLALGAIYSRALAEGGLRHALGTTASTILDIRLTIQNRPLGPADYQNLRTTVEQITRDRISFMLRDTQRHGRSQPDLPLLVRPDSELSLSTPLGRAFFLTDFEHHSRLLEGRWPETAAVVREDGVELEAVVGERAAAPMGIKVGSPVFILPFREDPSERIVINVVGLVEPIDPDEEYWMGTPSYFTIQEHNDLPLISFYVPEADFFGGVGGKYPYLVGDYEWFLFLDTGVLTVDTVQSTRDALKGLETDINKRFPRSTVLTFLENSNNTGLLSRYQRELTLARVPIFLFISLVVVVILYFLALVVGLLARSRSDEASLLQSRGASTVQTSGLFLLGEGIVIVLATLLGPVLAWVAFQNLLLPTISPAGQGGPLSIGFSADMFIWGAVGGLLSLGVLAGSSISLARLGILEFWRARARPPTVPFLQRYYVDLLLLAVLGLLLWQVQGRQGFVERAISGGDLEVDPTLLLGPALILLAAAFLMLRSLPFIARVLSWTAGRVAPSWVSFTLARLARDPLPFGSLAVIIMLSVALGVFGAAFQSTLSRSQQEQSLYNLGGDLVLTGVSFSSTTQEERYRELRSVPGVQAISPMYRDQVRTLDGPSSPSANLLGVEPLTLPEAAWFRDDFAPSGKSLSELLVPLRRGVSDLPDLSGYTASGIPVPPDARNIGLWVNAEDMDTNVLSPPLSLSLRMLDSRGNYRTLVLGEIPASDAMDQGWRYLQAPLPESQVFLQPPFSVVGIFLTTASFSRIPPGSLSFDDLTVAGGSNMSDQGEVIEGFEEPGRWVALPHGETEPDSVQVVSPTARSGQAGLTFSWIEALGSDARGLLIPAGPFPVPAIGGPGFQVGQVVRANSGGQIVPVAISDVTSFFPTVNTTFGPLLIVAMDDYTEYLRRAGGIVERPGEFWLVVDNNTDREQVIEALLGQLPGAARIRDRDAAVGIDSRNPLAGSSWNGLTLLSIAALTIAVTLALGTHAVVAVRNARVDLTVARVLGFSRVQMFLSLALERVIVTVLGLIVGGVLGYLLSRWVLGFMDTTAGGREIIPPVVFTTQAWVVVLTFICLIAAALLAITFAGLAASRLKASDILRTAQ
jgi:ABC-type lipoprotein release transport system permease subunit